MNLPSSTATSTSASSDTAAANFNNRCDDCGSGDSWVIHTVKLRGTRRLFCTHCLLRNHPTSFCPSCFVFYDSSPLHPSRRVTCSKCQSFTHTQCATDAKTPSSYLCPPCRNSSSFSFFRPIVGTNGLRSIDKSLAEAFLCAAKIAAFSMNKAVSIARCDAERRGREAALARKRAREALEHVVMLDAKEKARSVIPKLKEASFEAPANKVIDQKSKASPASNGTVKETGSSATTTTTTTKNNGGTERQSPAMQLDKVKQEAEDASK